MWVRASGGDGLDFDAGEVLTVALRAPIGLPTLELSDDELRRAAVRDHLRDDLRLGHERAPELHLAGVGDEMHLVERDGGAGLDFEEGNIEHLARLGMPLLAGDR